jgi:ABC-type transporter Mla subunit MlaD
MAGKRNAAPSKLLIAVLILAALAGGGIYYYYQCKTPDYTIIFGDSKEVAEGAGVFMAGVEVGRIVSVSPFETGVAVGIKVDRKQQPNLTEASRFFIEGQGEKGRVLVKNLSSNAKLLEPGQAVKGIDSAFQWSALDFAQGMNTFFESDEIRKAQEAMRTLVDDFDRQLNQIDWDALGKEMEQQMKELSKAMDEALNQEQVQQFQQELKKSLDEARQALDRAQQSPESQKLRKSIEDYLRNLEEMMSPQDTSIQKTSI